MSERIWRFEQKTLGVFLAPEKPPAYTSTLCVGNIYHIDYIMTSPLKI